jgi:hypothetical protein
VKVNTNLSPAQLEHVGRKLQDLAKSQRQASGPKPENSAEEKMLTQADRALDTMLDSLQSEVRRILQS